MRCQPTTARENAEGEVSGKKELVSTCVPGGAYLLNQTPIVRGSSDMGRRGSRPGTMACLNKHIRISLRFRDVRCSELPVGIQFGTKFSPFRAMIGIFGLFNHLRGPFIHSTQPIGEKPQCVGNNLERDRRVVRF